MKSIAYAIAGSACMAIAAFAPGLFASVASFWGGALLIALVLRTEP